jgi:hypothetical protein
MKKTILLLLFCGHFYPIFGQDPDISKNETDAIGRFDRSFRSSDLDENRAVGRRAGRSKRVSPPKNAFRVGCECMDGSMSEAHSTGACAGSGGVRFWLYRGAESGDTTRVLTARHEKHPQPLDAQELSNLAQKKAKKLKILLQSNADSAFRRGQINPQFGFYPYLVAPAMGLQQLSPPVDSTIYAIEKTFYGLLSVCALLGLRMLLVWLTPFRDEFLDALRDKLRHRR